MNLSIDNQQQQINKITNQETTQQPQENIAEYITNKRTEGNIIHIKNNNKHKETNQATPRITLTTKQGETTTTIQALPDTGATTNAINETTAKQLKLKITPVSPSSYNIKDANYKKIHITGKTTLNTTLDKTQKEIEILVSPNLQQEEIILGWQDMITFKILTKHFPLPCSKNKKCCNQKK